jgi:neutral amino acid transport system permease protein
MLALVLWVLLAPAGAYAQAQSVHGTLRAPDGTPVAGVTIIAARNGVEIGKATTARSGRWEIPLPGAGRYTVTLDVATLPGGLSPAREGGDTLRDVPVPAGESRAVIFQLTTGTPAPGTGPGQPGGGGGGPRRALLPAGWTSSPSFSSRASSSGRLSRLPPSGSR